MNWTGCFFLVINLFPFYSSSNWISPTSKKKAVIDKSDSDPHLLFLLELEEHKHFLYLLKPLEFQLKQVYFQIEGGFLKESSLNLFPCWFENQSSTALISFIYLVYLRFCKLIFERWKQFNKSFWNSYTIS